MYVHLFDEKQKSTLELLSTLRVVGDFYLAGGTALALHYGHRESLDLDFFSEQSFSVDKIQRELEALGKTDIRRKEENTLLLLFEDFSCSFFQYPYPLLHELAKFNRHLSLADVRDLAAMKLSAISTRGTRRDFVDLYFICTKDYSLQEAVTFFEKKFQRSGPSVYHLYRSLLYFADAESDEMPNMYQSTEWSDIRQFFEREVNQLMDSN